MKLAIFELEKLRKFLVILLIISSYSVFSQYYTGSNIPFGQNRVQYNSFFWQSFEFERSKVYFSKGGREHAKFAAKTAYEYQKELEKFIDFSIEEKIHLIIYNSQSKFRQSNIGLNNEISSNIGGTSNIEGQKIFLYFNGNHVDFKNQIKRGVAEILVNKILYGTDWKQTVKNTTFINLPSWFKEGLVNYLSQDWNTKLDSKLKDLILSGKTKSFQSLTKLESRLYGHGLWRYIDIVFGKNMIPNLMYMMKVSKSVESGFIYVLGVSSEMIQQDFLDHFRIQYSNDVVNCITPNENKLNIKTKKDRTVRQIRINSDGSKIAFSEHYLGQYKVKVFDVKKNKIETIIKGDYKLNRIPDLSYPILDWHPNGKVLAIFEERKGGITLNLYDILNKKKNIKYLLGLEKILSASYNKKGAKLVLSAVKDSYSDLFEYTVLGNNHKQLTNDIYDDLDAKYVPNSDQIIFSSNRPYSNNKSNLFRNNFDLFKISTVNQKITRLTNTDNFNEIQPQPTTKYDYNFLCDENGIYNHYQTILDSTISHIDTMIHYRYISSTHQLSHFSRNSLEIDFSSKTSKYSLLYFKNNNYQFYLGDKKNYTMFENKSSSTYFKTINTKNLSSNDKVKSVNDEEKVNIYNYRFEDEKKQLLESKDFKKTESVRNNKIKLPTQKVYNINFTIGEFIMQLNPTFNNQAYQRYSSSGFKNAGFDGFTLVQAKDVFEDYKISGGLKGPVQINNIGLIAIYENLKNRIDQRTQVSRQSFEDVFSDEIIKKTVVNDIKHQFSYPFNEVSSLRLTTNVRFDKVTTLSNSPTTLKTPNDNFILFGGLLEYVFDITRPISLNVNNGLKFKTWVEGYNELLNPNTDFFVLGLDFRNYQKIHRNIVFASRIAASTSLGSQRLLYYLGGVDGYLWANFDPTILPDPNLNFQFQTIASPVRGFYQNARNGNSFIAISNEIRIPLFSYFSKKPLSSDFLENFMVIGFGDIGSAWTGKTPYSIENSFNSSIINGHNYTINIKSQKEPIIYSYGFGLRSRIFGYYLRLDWGYGIDDKILMPSIKQLSLSLDF